MRKADYEMLAVIIAAEIDFARRELKIANAKYDTHNAVLYDGQLTAATRIAEIFAKRASVNAPQFLVACGITPT